jgi:hypothetical protein
VGIGAAEKSFCAAFGQAGGTAESAVVTLKLSDMAGFLLF